MAKDYDAEREKRSQTELRKAFRELFPLSFEGDLPSEPSEIKGFLRDRISQEAADRVFHFTSGACRVLCEVTHPKTWFVDMCRAVVEEVKQARQDRAKLAAAVEVTAERDEMLERLTEIGKLIGCNHVNDPDGRAKLVQCLEDSLAKRV